MTQEEQKRQERLQCALITAVVYAGQLAGKDGDHYACDADECIRVAANIIAVCLCNKQNASSKPKEP